MNKELKFGKLSNLQHPPSALQVCLVNPQVLSPFLAVPGLTALSSLAA